jgi:GNAT superfamily N-acetyltransferase
MRELTTTAELSDACDGDSLCLWVAQGLGARGRAWAGEDAVLAAAPDISTRDRLAVWARSPEAAVELYREVAPQLPRSFRPFGERRLIAALAQATPGLEVVGHFGWMDTSAVSVSADPRAQWLDESDAEDIATVLDLAFPTSYARPGVPGVQRWAGVRDGAQLLVVGALAWSSPEVALVSGVAVTPEARGKGLGLTACSLLVDAALAEHGAVGLMVEDWNVPGQRLYQRLGLRRRAVSAAAFAQQ